MRKMVQKQIIKTYNDETMEGKIYDKKVDMVLVEMGFRQRMGDLFTDLKIEKTRYGYKYSYKLRI